MKKVLPMTVLVLALAASARLHAEMECPHGMEPTIDSLAHCVVHAAEMGHIDNSGIAGSLLAKLEAAAAALEREQPGVAIRVLGAFIHEATAQAGRHVDAEHAGHMIHHAHLVIEALAP